MPGLCGWFGGAPVAAHGQVLDAMARPLVRFGGSVLANSNPKAGLASAGRNGGLALSSCDGATIAWCGTPRAADPDLARRAEEAGLASAIVELWRRAPDAVCSQLAGHFSLVVVDGRTDSALLATDRCAVHPLWWWFGGAELVFGSSCDAIGAHPSVTLQVDPQAIHDYVHWHMVPGPHSVYREVQRLLPGSALLLRAGRIEVRRYWEPSFDEEDRTPLAELEAEFAGHLRRCVGRSLQPGRKIGAFLSGGTDSSTLSGILHELSGDADTYSIGFGAEGYDEMAYARIAARHFGTRHHEYYVTPDDVLDTIPRIAAIFDQPFGNASAVAAYHCARIAREDAIDILLGGDGGDELFGGNERYARQRVFAWYERIPSALRRSLLEPLVFGLPGGGTLPPLRKARSYIDQANTPMPARLERHNLLAHYGAEAVFAPDFLQEVDLVRPMRDLGEYYARCTAPSLINRMLALDMKITLADSDLPKVSGACDLAGVRAGFPFLDDEMLDFAARLAPRLKLRGGRLRWFFKHALRDFLPEQILHKTKHGFGLPFGVWLQTHRGLRDMAGDSLSALRARGVIRSDFADALLTHRLREHAAYHGTMVWVLMMLEQWFRKSPRG